jgi:glutamate-1-semialdehyde 2,1-aminomutase
VRTARVVTGRDGVLRFAGAYHGSAEAALPLDAPGLPATSRADLITTPQADAAAFLAALERDGQRVACVVIDLMPNRAGLVPVPDAFAALVRAETRRRGILLVVDEVITARLGVAGLHARYALEPDLVTLGKIIGGGFAVGAFGGSADVMGVLDPRRDDALPHAGTFSANPVTMRAGLAAMDMLSADAITRINTLGDALRDRIGRLGYAVSGAGSLFRLVEVEQDPQLWWRMYDAGVLVGTNGLCSVSTVMRDEDADQVVDALRAARA